MAPPTLFFQAPPNNHDPRPTLARVGKPPSRTPVNSTTAPPANSAAPPQ